MTLREKGAALLRRPAFWLSVFVLTALGLLPMGYIGQDHDDALYFLAAQSLREGRYRHWFLPGSPPITNLTPGFPAFLAPIAFLFPDNALACQLWAGLALLACTGAVWLFFRRRQDAPTAVLLTGLFALNPLVLGRLGVVMPEAPFLLGALGFFLLWEKNRLPDFAAGTWLSVLYLIRPAALPLWGAVGASLLLQRRFRSLLKTFAIPALTYFLWARWSGQGGGVEESVELNLLYGGKGPGQWFLNAGLNAAQLARTWGATVLPVGWARGGAAPWVGAVLLLLAVVGLARILRRKPADVPMGFLALSLGMHLAWPWWYDRYLLPLLPFLWLGLAATAADLDRRFSPRVRRGLLGGVLVLSFVGQSVFWFDPAARRNTPELADSYAWIQSHTSPADGFMSLFYGRDLIHTQRVFLPPPPAEDAAALDAALAQRRVRYVLWDRTIQLGFSDGRNPVTSAVDRLTRSLEDPARFRLVHEDTSGRARIYERRKGRAGTN